MGTYTELIIAGYPVISSKSAVIPEVMTVFRETDRHIVTRRITERNALVWGEPDNPNDDETETVIEYACETGKVIDRLNVMGFTLRRVQEEFEAGRRAKLDEYAAWAKEESDNEWFDEDWKLLKDLTFDAYITAFSQVISDGLRPVPFEDHEKKGLDPVIKYILGDNDEYLFGFFGNDVRLLLRLACNVAPVNSLVTQDITGLVQSGYYEEEELVCDNAIRELTLGHPENSPRIILTEGSTDAVILKEALTLLYPHLTEYYSFLDFISTRSPGGAPYLVSLVKAFSAAGITNRIIALFDNDTAANEARRTLETISLPPNIAIRAYPELDLLRGYPTLGPGGLTSLNVNGLAASIELYLGEDVLRDGQGTLTPIQWKGYSEALKQYQGEVMGKSKLHATFHDKVARCRADPELLKVTDWSGLSIILQDIFRAFD
jgi:hypothetical protein